MDWGLENRLSRIIQPDTGRCVMLAVDHGYFLGPVTKLEEPRDTLDPLIPHADALMITRGVLRNCVEATEDIPIVLRVSGGRSVLNKDLLSDEGLATSVEDAIRLNVSAMAMSIFIGSDHEHQNVVNLAKLVDEGTRYGIPVLGVTAVGKELEKRDARYLALACRMAAEFGAHFVKTYWCEDFEKVAESCPVPIVIAGGPKMETEMDVFRVAADAIGRGAAGVDMGRNIWQNPHPEAMLLAVRAIVHQDASATEAHDLFTEMTESESDEAGE